MNPLDLAPFLLTIGTRVRERRQRRTLSMSAASKARTAALRQANARFEGRGA